MPTLKATARSRRVTAQQVADHAGVSLSAVSRAFTPGASVSKSTLSRVQKAAETLGYQPNALARSLMTGRTELIGLASNNFDNPAFMEIFDLFTRTLQERGLRPLLVNLSGSSSPDQAVAMLRQYNVDAVIVASSTVSKPFIDGCVAAHIPLVHAFGRAVNRSPLHVAGTDNVQGGKLAAQTLLDLGYGRIAFLGGPRTASSTVDRLSGFRSALKAQGLAPVTEVFAATYAYEEGRRLMHALLAGQPFEAVFCGDDILAIGALDACREAGKPVPAEMGVLGFNDIAMASWSAYNLSTIRQPIADIIITAVDLAIELVENLEPQTNPRRFACEAVLRSTLRKR